MRAIPSPIRAPVAKSRWECAMEPLRSMFREAIVSMAPYVPGEQPKPGERLIKLNTNENPYPPSPRIRAAIVKAVAGDALRLYPRPMADEFIEAASRYYRFPRE